jgi:hypothetical protein
MSDDKMKNVSRETLPSCVAFGLRYWKRLCSKFDRVGFDWMPSKVQKKWFLACHAYEFLHGLVDDDVERYFVDYKLFVLLGYKLIDLLSSVDLALKTFDDKEN